MKELNRHLIFQRYLFIVFSFFVFCANAGTSFCPGSDTIPLDPAVRYGKLKNGFTYYISSSRSQHEIEMRLVTKAGSYHEDEDQLGLAHLLEHVGCRSTVHFPQGVYNYIESKGLIKGNNLNAGTVDTYTYYYLRFPNNKTDMKEKGLYMLRDWAHGILLDSIEIDAERGAVFQEEALGNNGFMERINSQVFYRPGPGYYSEQREKMLRNVKNFKHASLRRFYNDWYRPDLQAAIIVGDVDADEIEAQITALFSDLNNPKNPREIKNVLTDKGVSLTGKNQFIEIIDKDLTDIRVQVLMKKRAVGGILDKKVTVEDYRKHTMDDLHNILISARWARHNEEHSPVLNIHQTIIRAALDKTAQVDVLQTFIRARSPQSLPSAFMASMKGLEQVRRFGFTDAELNAAKNKFLKMYNARDGFDVHRNSGNLTDHFVYGAAAPGFEYEKELINGLIAEITLQEINESIKIWINTHENMDIVVLTNENEKKLLPREEDLQRWIQEAESADVEPYRESVQPEAITLIPSDKLKKLPVAGVYKYEEIKALGVTKLVLQNGAQVILRPFKPMGDKKDMILMQGFSPGGALLYEGDDYASADYSANIVKNAGVGNLNATELRMYLKSKGIAIYPYIDAREEGIHGSSSNKDFEELLQLAYLYFTAPRKDADAYEQWLSRVSDPKTGHWGKFQEMILASTKCEKNQTSVKDVQLDRAYQIYEERFGNAADFVFVISGDFELDKAIPIVLKYLGNLPSTGRKELMKDVPECEHDGVLKKTVHGNGTEATIRLIFPGQYTFSEKNNVELAALANALELVLMERMRNKEGGVYVVTAAVDYSLRSAGSFQFIVGFRCDPDNKDRMVEAALDQINNLRLHGVDSETFQRVKEIEKQKLQSKLNSNLFWQYYLADRYRYGRDPLAITKHAELIDDIQIGLMKDLASKCLSDKNYMLFELL